MTNVLITGANRGIGLGLVHAYLAHTDAHIFAACRNPATATDLQGNERITPVKLDVSDDGSIAAAVQQVQAATGALDILINNAGVFPEADRNKNLSAANREAIAQTLSVNSISPIFVTQAFTDLLRAADNAAVAMITSNMGSITNTASGNAYGYRMSKAAVNMAGRVMSNDLRGAGIRVLPIDPGWVQTDMGGESAALTTQQSAEGIMNVIANATMDDSGKYWRYDGSTLDW